MLAFVRNHRTAVRAAAAVGAIVVALALVWFQPWKLFVDEVVSEAAPDAGTPSAIASASGTPSPSGSAARTLSTGRFRSLEHETTGTASIVRLADGSRILRFEDLRTSNGPDLVVYLSSTPATEDGWRAYDDDLYVNLGKLKGNLGDQNYRIPADVDLSKFRSAVVWCRRFTVGFGAAPISVA